MRPTKRTPAGTLLLAMRAEKAFVELAESGKELWRHPVPDLPVVAVSNLVALAQRHFREGGHRRILAAFDARMGEVYWGAFQVDGGGLARGLGPEQVTAPERVAVPEGEGWHGVGSGWGTHGAVLAERVGQALSSLTPDLVCHAHEVAVLGAALFAEGEGVSAERALPVYLRDQVAWVKIR